MKRDLFARLPLILFLAVLALLCVPGDADAGLIRRKCRPVRQFFAGYNGSCRPAASATPAFTQGAATSCPGGVCPVPTRTR